jgi:nitrate reductase gamma subunit
MLHGMANTVGRSCWTILRRSAAMPSKADIFILIACVIAFVLGVYLWFTGNHEQGMFAAMWVPALLCFGIYFKLLCQKK